MSIATPPQVLLTAEEFARLPDSVRGQVVEVDMPPPRHGLICSKIDRSIGNQGGGIP